MVTAITGSFPLSLGFSLRHSGEQNQVAVTVYRNVKTETKILFHYVLILFNRVEMTDFQSVCQEKGGANSGGTSFLFKVRLLFLILPTTRSETKNFRTDNQTHIISFHLKNRFAKRFRVNK